MCERVLPTTATYQHRLGHDLGHLGCGQDEQPDAEVRGCVGVHVAGWRPAHGLAVPEQPGRLQRLGAEAGLNNQPSKKNRAQSSLFWIRGVFLHP